MILICTVDLADWLALLDMNFLEQSTMTYGRVGYHPAVSNVLGAKLKQYSSGLRWAGISDSAATTYHCFSLPYSITRVGCHE